MIKRIGAASPAVVARIAGVFYLMVFVTGMFALFAGGGIGAAAGMIAGAFYIAVTVLFYYIFRPVNSSLSLVAAVVSLVGIVIGPLSFIIPAASKISPLVFFGFYCLLIGYLILNSTFLPRVLGVLMIFAALGWLTFLWPPLANRLSPYVFAPGIIGEGALTLWLLVKGVDERRWKEQAL